MEQRISMGQAIGKVCELAGHSISETILNKLLNELYPDHPRRCSWKIPMAIIPHIASYWREHHKPSKKPPIREWMAAHSLAIPPLAEPLPPVVVSAKRKEATPSIDERRIERIIQEKLASIVEESVAKAIAARVEPVRAQITERMKAPRSNYPRAEKIISKIKAFAMRNPITVDDAWNACYRKFQTLHEWRTR